VQNTCFEAIHQFGAEFDQGKYMFQLGLTMLHSATWPM